MCKDSVSGLCWELEIPKEDAASAFAELRGMVAGVLVCGCVWVCLGVCRCGGVRGRGCEDVWVWEYVWSRVFGCV